MRQIQRVPAPRAARGFTLVESAIALGLLLAVAAVVTWSLSAAFAVKAATETQERLSRVLAAHLDDVALVPLTDLTAGTFTVPKPCSASKPGIDGTSCAQLGGQTVEIAYRFTTASGTAPCPQASADPDKALSESGQVSVQACITSVTSGAFNGQSGTRPNVPAQMRTLRPDRPGAVDAGRKIHVNLSGTFDALEDRPLLLLDAANPNRTLATARRAGSTATFTLPPATQEPACTLALPCVLGLSNGTAYATTPAPAPGDEQITLSLVDSAGTGATVLAPEHGTAIAYAHLTPAEGGVP